MLCVFLHIKEAASYSMLCVFLHIREAASYSVLCVFLHIMLFLLLLKLLTQPLLCKFWKLQLSGWE